MIHLLLFSNGLNCYSRVKVILFSPINIHKIYMGAHCDRNKITNYIERVSLKNTVHKASNFL